MINFNSKKQRFQLQKLFEELNQHDELAILKDFQSYIGFNGDSGSMYAVLENLPNMKDEETLCIHADEDGEVYYMITGEDGEETEYTYGELLNLGQEQEGQRIYLFEFQGKTYFKSLDYDFIYDREKKEIIGKWSEELQKIILNDEED